MSSIRLSVSKALGFTGQAELGAAEGSVGRLGGMLRLRFGSLPNQRARSAAPRFPRGAPGWRNPLSPRISSRPDASNRQ